MFKHLTYTLQQILAPRYLLGSETRIIDYASEFPAYGIAVPPTGNEVTSFRGLLFVRLCGSDRLFVVLLYLIGLFVLLTTALCCFLATLFVTRRSTVVKFGASWLR